jgi:hypothetical protein
MNVTREGTKRGDQRCTARPVVHRPRRPACAGKPCQLLAHGGRVAGDHTERLHLRSACGAEIQHQILDARKAGFSTHVPGARREQRRHRPLRGVNQHGMGLVHEVVHPASSTNGRGAVLPDRRDLVAELVHVREKDQVCGPAAEGHRHVPAFVSLAPGPRRHRWYQTLYHIAYRRFVPGDAVRFDNRTEDVDE